MSGWRVQSSGVAIERYWWIRANAIGWENVSLPRGGVGSSGGSPSAIRLALPESMAAQLFLVEAGELRGAERDQERGGCCPYG